MDIHPIAARLKEERERLGMTQPVFAEAAAAKKRTLIDWEKGVSSPTAVQLAALAGIGVDVAYVLTGSRLFTPPSPISHEHQGIIRDYEASSLDGKEAIRRMAAATALGAAAAAGARRSGAPGSRKYLGPVTHQEFHESAPIVGQVVTTKPRKRKS